MSVQELKTAITQLPSRELDELVQWLADYREDEWDKQIAEDSVAGRLDHLVAEAKREFEAGRYRKL
jgi:hypothetical protein